MIDVNKIKAGDRITFRSPTRSTGGAKATRMVKGVIPSPNDGGGHVRVAYVGYHNFYVKASEIIEVYQP